MLTIPGLSDDPRIGHRYTQIPFSPSLAFGNRQLSMASQGWGRYTSPVPNIATRLWLESLNIATYSIVYQGGGRGNFGAT